MCMHALALLPLGKTCLAPYKAAHAPCSAVSNPAGSLTCVRAASLLLSTDAPSHCATLPTRPAAAPAAVAVAGGEGARGVLRELPPCAAPAALTAPGCSSFCV